jgi:hypothetical protein
MLKPKHIFFRIVGHRLFKPACIVLLAVWAHQTFLTSTPPKANPATYQNTTHLSDAEMEYYTQHFDYVMNAGKDGAASAWETYSSKGSITPEAPFKSKSGADCRPFSESYTIGVQSGKAQGFACKREGETTWCKLKPNTMQSCALETLQNPIEKAVDSAKLLVKGTVDFW